MGIEMGIRGPADASWFQDPSLGISQPRVSEIVRGKVELLSLDFLRPELAGKYRLRLSDLKPIRDLRAGETFVPANIYHAGLVWQNRS
jgi:hypothetical protein